MTLSSSGKIKTNILFALGFFLALFQLLAPIFLTDLLDIQFRAVHVAFGLSIAFLYYPFRRTAEDDSEVKGISPFDILLIVLLLAANLNAFIKALNIYMGTVEPGMLDMFLGITLVLLVLEAARRTVGLAIPVMVVLLMGYIYMGDSFPGIWKLRGINFEFVINSLYYSPLGIFGGVTGMSATFISMFIIFGSLLSATGGGKTFIDIALAITGKYTGGPAKAAVVSSALFGSISGSSVANVMVTGSYTIPLMKRLGYKPEFAAAVEAIASSGGGITPPIMSISAFMMAEFLNISYFHIIGYALLPCLLYYAGVFSGVHFRTVRMGIDRLPPEEIPLWKDILTLERIAGLIIPTGVLLYLIGIGQPLQLAGFYACASALAVFFFIGIVKGKMAETMKLIFSALSEGGRDVAQIVPILVSVSMLVNLIGLTGLAPKISGVILEVGGTNIYFSLLIATIVPFLLGTSLPVVPTYVLSVSILVPPLLKLGIDPVAAHLFFIYWAILGGVTPPTCTAAVAAAGIAKANWVKTGFMAVRLGAVAFILPYFFALNPALVGRAPYASILTHGLTGFIGAISIAYGLFSSRGENASVNFLFCAAFIVGGLLLLFPDTAPSIVGMVLVGAALLLDKKFFSRNSSPKIQVL
ncbi:MAG: TRAP transporter fused permease subunit [Synergistaceae bacterium]|nr:TRAP transporter fused permease subunit [Synergistaceae bacterium]